MSRRSCFALLALRRALPSTLLCLTAWLASPAAAAAAPDEPAREWTVRLRGVMSGSSTHSDPAGYVAYSGLAVEGAVARQLAHYLSVELSLRTESREVDQRQGTGPDARLGSLDLLPVALMVQLHPWDGTFRPYAGAGANLTLCWEKTGALDDTQVSPSLGPAVELGVDISLGVALVLNLDLRWNLLRPEVSRAGTKVVSLHIDPLTLGAGVGLRL